jgi:hypothetical protein
MDGDAARHARLVYPSRKTRLGFASVHGDNLLILKMTIANLHFAICILQF